MTWARDEILARIRSALDDVPENDVPVIPGEFRRAGTVPPGEMVALFAERVAEYRATVERLPESLLPEAIGGACRRRGATRLVVPDDVPSTWLPGTMTVVRDSGLTAADLDGVDGAITGCALGIAETGTIALDAGPYQGRRALTLLPDFHLCVIFEDQIVSTPPEGVAGLHDAAREGRPITLISGPSATSDIELNRVEGVHGPRTLHVLVVSR